MNGIYIHIPFCVRKCLYCDFLSFNKCDEVKNAYMDILKEEIKAFYTFPHSQGFSKKVDTIFIGGGTPSVVLPEMLKEVLDSVYTTFDVDGNAEISMEVNPMTVTDSSLEQYRKMGINRLSIGVQSFNDYELAGLGRIHTADVARKTIKMAKEAGYDNINIDLMTNVPHQTADSLRHSLECAIESGVNHISVYSLIVEENTPFYDMYGDDYFNDDEARDYIDMTNNLLREQGFMQYEISNYAKAGYECRHNIKYWTHEDYAGFGLGASSKIGNVRYKNETDIDHYIYNVKNGHRVTYVEEELDKEDAMKEFLILGMRMNRGISVDGFKEKFNENIPQKFMNVLNKYAGKGLVKISENHINLTYEGRYLSNIVFSEII